MMIDVTSRRRSLTGVLSAIACFRQLPPQWV